MRPTGSTHTTGKGTRSVLHAPQRPYFATHPSAGRTGRLRSARGRGECGRTSKIATSVYMYTLLQHKPNRLKPDAARWNGSDSATCSGSNRARRTEQRSGSHREIVGASSRHHPACPSARFGSGTCQRGMSAARGRASNPAHRVVAVTGKPSSAPTSAQAGRFGSMRSSLLLMRETKDASMAMPKHMVYSVRS